MPHSEQHTITFTRDMDRAIQQKSFTNSVNSLLSSISTKSLNNRGWSFCDVMGSLTEVDGGETARRYQWEMQIDFAHPTNVPASTEFAGILYTLYGRAMTPAFGRWNLTHVDGTEYQPPSDDEQVSSKIDKDLIGYADCTIPEDWPVHFEHLYGLEAHIFRVRSAITAAIQSNFANRFNVVLVGPPGCGKSDIANSVKAALGEDAVMAFDATSTTAAGMIKELSERDILPRVIVFEEIEKATEASMQPLLGMLDQRAEVRKLTARGAIQRDTKILAIATVNDYALFQKLQAGALSSRFSNVVHFSRPSRETLAMILHREVTKVNGDAAWVKPALDFCEENNIDDPRQVISICLCGQNDLLTGEYQKMMEATSLQAE